MDAIFRPFLDHPILVVLLICAVGALIGWRDVVRLSLRRIWAIGRVGYRESIRRRVLWITPLAILGAVAIAQLQHPTDEQDAIRQTTKICLFAAGMVVVVTAIILASTNLPREIESRVIYTIVTKPATRLEIILGKVVGFAMVSAVILAIMGAFTFAYLNLRAWNLRGLVAEKLELEPEGSPNRATLEHYVSAGLLSTRAVERPDDLQVFAEPPTAGGPRWMAGGYGHLALYRFDLSEDEKELVAGFAQLTAEDAKRRGGTQDFYRTGPGVYLYARNQFASGELAFVSTEPTAEQAEEIRSMGLPELPRALRPDPAPGSPLRRDNAGGLLPLPGSDPDNAVPGLDLTGGDGGRTKTFYPAPQLTLQILDENRSRLVEPNELRHLPPGMDPNDPAANSGPYKPPAINLADLPHPPVYKLPSEAAYKMATAGRFHVVLVAYTPAVKYAVDGESLSLDLVDPDGNVVGRINAVPWPDPDAGGLAGGSEGGSDDGSAGAQSLAIAAMPRIETSPGRYGMQLTGAAPDDAPVAVYRFDDPDLGAGGSDAGGDGGSLTLELKVGVERGGSEEALGDDETLPAIALKVRDRATDEVADVGTVRPESNRVTFVSVPRSALPPGGGSFDVLVSCHTPGQWVGMGMQSMTLATADRSFTFNLAKSLSILWLMSVLVVAIAVFCSTIVSWPIAVVLTLVLLLGRWGVEQLGDAAGPGLGLTVTTQADDWRKAMVVRQSVNALSALLQGLAAVLPDVSQFAAVEDIERGIAIRPQRLAGAAAVALGYGLPMIVLAYLRLKYREVAL